MRRREFIAGLAGATAWAATTRAQLSAMPVVGLLNGVSNGGYANRITAIREGLKDTGFTEGQNVTIKYRSAEGRYDRLPDLAVDLVRQHVALIITIGGTPSAQAAKAATSTIPIVFSVGSDAVNSGLVTSLNRPEANVTGVSFTNTELGAKRMELLSELLPQATSIAFIANPTLGAIYDPSVQNLLAAAKYLGLRLIVFNAATAADIDTAFAEIMEQKIPAVVVQNDSFLNARRDQIVSLSRLHLLPAIYGDSEPVHAGGLMSYGVSYAELYRWVGIYAGRILKGTRPTDLPIMQPAKFKLTINLKTATAFGLTIPETLLATADEVIQ
jgi:putative tryptophan/tyrosine transport system substrate-binding protein